MLTRLCAVWKRAGVRATPAMRVKEVAEQNGLGPMEVFDMLKKISEAES